MAEVARNVVIGGLGFGTDDAADRVREAVLHVEAGKCREDALHLIRRDPVVLRAAVIETDASGAERNFRLFVQADRRCGIQSDGVPDQLHAAIVEALLARERPRCVGSFDLEALWAREAVREPQVVNQRADGNDFRVVRYPLQLSEPDRKEPRSDSMVEEKG